MPKLMIENKEVVKGDWIVVKGDGWEEIGCVVDIDEDEINMFDGKEGWTVNREEITEMVFNMGHDIHTAIHVATYLGR